MLQVTNEPKVPFAIKSIRRATVAEPRAAVCSIEPGDGSDKPPC